MKSFPYAKYFLIGGIAAVTTFGVGVYIASLQPNDVLYVLNQNVNGRSQITPDMLTAKPVRADDLPPNAIGIEEIQKGAFYARISLKEGDVLSLSNTDAYQDIADAVDDSWETFAFKVDADSAAGGRINRGSYFNMLVTDPSGTYYHLVNALALDATISANSLSSQDAINTEEAKSGQVSLYTIALPQGTATARTVDVTRNKSGALSLTLAPREFGYREPNMDNFKGLFSANRNEPASTFLAGDGTQELPVPDPINAGIGTDPTFTARERGDAGEPTGPILTCGEGNYRRGGACSNNPVTQPTPHTPSPSPSSTADTTTPAPAVQPETAEPAPAPTSQ